jgi:site-specific DNA-methyltransferase (adenine-specific)
MIEVNKIYNMDCMDMLRQIPDNSISLCLADPPYGIDFQSARRIDSSQWKPKIKNDGRPFTDWLAPLYPKMTEGGRLVCFYRWDVQNEFQQEIEAAGFTIKSQLVWNKLVHGMGDLKGEFGPAHELMFYATKGRYEFTGKRPTTVYNVQRLNGSKMIHPNEKPVELLSQIIKDLTSESTELIVDPFGGSFSTFIAARLLNRKCISCELDEYYFNIGQQRVNREINYKNELF